jgi:tetratricopeptide (TPR) repeat protein
MFRKRQPPPQIEVGSVLNDRYRLDEQLGAGGAGVVYRAEDLQLSRTVAIKVLIGEGHMSGDKLERFRSEARSVARLNHPNIITLYDYAEAQGRPYLVIEYIPGQDLWELDSSYAPDLMPLEQSIPITGDILAALEYSHSHHVIHRDLKPENVMITPDKQVKVMDFGLARIEGQSRLTQDGLVAGTAAYLAPELALGERGDHRSDLYAVGVMLYELTTGRRPFSGDDPLTVISQHIHAPVVPPQHYNTNIPDGLQGVILKLLSKKPDERYSDAAEVRQDLNPILDLVRFGQSRTPTVETVLYTAPTAQEASQALLERIDRGKMYGRETELGDLKDRWDRVRLGEYQAEPLLLVAGEAGIGKTRLLRELEVYAGLRDGYLLQGTAREQDAGTPYAVVAAILRNYIKDQSPEVLRQQMPGSIAGEVVKLAPQLAEKLGHIQPNPPLEPAAERTRLLERVTSFLLNMAYEQPTLLLLDDLHFADPGSLDILGMVVRQSRGTSLLAAGAYRDVALSYSNPTNRLITALEADDLACHIPLRRLATPVVAQMLEGLLGSEVSGQFIDSIFLATEGNPLFIEETIKSLAVDGQIRLNKGRWEQQHSTLLHVPGSIKAVLGKRLDFVNRSTLELLQLAAVIGRSFGLNLLLEASPFDDEVIQYAIEEALSAQLIEVSGIVDGPNRSTATEIAIFYQFQHALIRETLYEELRPLRRRQLHRRVAVAIEKLAQEQPINNPATLANHLINGAQDEAAIPYLRQAGENAYRYYANEEALDYLGQAGEILEDLAPELLGQERQSNLAEQFDLLSWQRNVCNMMGDREREFLLLEKLQIVAEAMADKRRWIEVMSRLATYYWHIGKLEQAEETAHKALEVSHEEGDEQGEQYALERIARVLWTRRDPRAMEYATQALTLAQRRDDRVRQGRLTNLIGNIYTDTLREPDRALIFFNQAIEICRDTNNPYEEAWTLWGMGGLAMLVDDYTTALSRLAAARKIAEDIGATLQVGWDIYHSGDAWFNLGDYVQALEHYQQAQEIFKSSQHPRGNIRALISLGLASLALGRNDQALSRLEDASKQAEARNDMSLMFRSYQALATHHLKLREPELLTHAVRLSNRIIKLAVREDNSEHELLGYYLRASGFFELRNLQEALSSSAQAVSRLEQSVYIESPKISVAEILYTHSRIAGSMGQFDTARHFLQQAHADLLRQADMIADGTLRDQFLTRVPVNRQIMAAARG